MTTKKVNKNIFELSLALSKADDVEMINDFLKCILTNSELNEVAGRWALVKMLDKGMSQRSIAANLGLSLCKITRGSKELQKADSAFKKMINI